MNELAAVAQWLVSFADEDPRCFILTVFDDGDMRAFEDDSYIISEESDWVTVTMSDPLYELYCHYAGIECTNV